MTDPHPSVPHSDPAGPRPGDEEAARLLEAGLTDSAPAGRAAPPRPEDVAPHFPALEILEVLGQGGMGVVYKARQRKLDRLVALKVLPRDLSGDPAFAERFAREARTLAKLDHPNVVRVHEFGDVDGLYYLLLEYVDGASLRQVMDAGRLAPEEALAIVPQICEALQYAHDQGVVHRDIKPENVLIDGRGRVKIADFGLAKLTDRGPADLTLTGTRQVMGTFQYMAPEQYRSPQDVDHRADIFSLGVVFYEMLTGELPVGRFQKPSEARDLDRRIDGIVMRALERERERRYQRASEVGRDVTRVGSTGVVAPDGPPAAPAGGRAAGRTALAWLVVAAALIPLGIGVAAFLREFHRRLFDMEAYEAWITAGWVVSALWLAGAAIALVVAWQTRRERTRPWIHRTAIPLAILLIVGIGVFWSHASQEARDLYWARRPRDPWAALAPTPLPDPLPRVEGVRTAEETQAVVEAVLGTWNAYVDRVRDGDLEREDASDLYTDEDTLRVVDMEEEDFEREKEAHTLGMGFVGRDLLPAPPHHLRVSSIEVGPWENEARVTVVKRFPPDDVRFEFPMKRWRGSWRFALGEVEIRRTP